MRRLTSRRGRGAGVALVVALFAVPLLAAPVGADPLPAFEGPETVSVSEMRDLTPSVAWLAIAAAWDAGGRATVLHSGALKLERVTRGAAVVQQAPRGYAFPMWSGAGSATDLAELRGPEVGAALAAGTAVMGRTTADLRGAVAGDVVHLMGWHGRRVAVTVGLVADDSLMGGAELLFSTDLAATFGFVRMSRVLLWGFSSREAIDAALAGRGLVRGDVRIRHSWDPPDPDGQLSYAETKRLLGEPAYRTVRGRVLLDGRWVTASLPARRRPLDGGIPVSARCHVVVERDLQAALAELREGGLAALVDVADTNRWGGCFQPRLVRDLGRNVGGQLSRHTWGMAFDVNVRTNAMGTEPQLDCRVVRIFRKHGFAWGGNFLTPDGMHFEWVGERRDQLAYPSTRCPNEVAEPTVGG